MLWYDYGFEDGSWILVENGLSGAELINAIFTHGRLIAIEESRREV